MVYADIISKKYSTCADNQKRQCPPIWKSLSGDVLTIRLRQLEPAAGLRLRRLLDRRFRQITGRSILDVVQETRLENVCSLLRSTRLPISEICKTVAFGSGTYLLRLFRDKMGMTMRAYRKSSQCGG